MLQKAADEFHNIEGQDFGALAVRFAVANPHRAVLDGNDARVGNGDFEDVGGEIFDSGLAGANRLAVDVPGDLPEIRWNLIEQIGLLQQIAELGSEDYRESFDGEKEIDSGRMPRAIGRTDSAARNDVVNVGMVLKIRPQVCSTPKKPGRSPPMCF